MTIGERLIETIKDIANEREYSSLVFAWLFESMIIPVLWDLSVYLESDETEIQINGQTFGKSGNFLFDAMRVFAGIDIMRHATETAKIERFIRAVLSSEAKDDDIENMWYDAEYISDIWNSLAEADA